MSLAINGEEPWISYDVAELKDHVEVTREKWPGITLVLYELKGWQRVEIPMLARDVQDLLLTREPKGTRITSNDKFIVKVINAIGRDHLSEPFGAELYLN